MRLSPYEMETIISWDRSSEKATIYTCNPTDMKKFDAAPEIYKLKKEEKFGKQVVAKTYQCDKKFITLRKKIIKRRKNETTEN